MHTPSLSLKNQWANELEGPEAVIDISELGSEYARQILRLLKPKPLKPAHLRETEALPHHKSEPQLMRQLQEHLGQKLINRRPQD
jgi:hypothetical protein